MKAEVSERIVEAADEVLDAISRRPDANHDAYVGLTLMDRCGQVHGDGTAYVDGDRFDAESEPFQ